MSTHTLDLIFKDDRKSESPHPPRAFVCLKTVMQHVENGPYLLTPDCVSLTEFEFEIDRLHRELDVIRQKARAKFAAEAKRYVK